MKSIGIHPGLASRGVLLVSKRFLLRQKRGAIARMFDKTSSKNADKTTGESESSSNEIVARDNIVQIGDPILRLRTQQVEVADIKKPLVQDTISQLKKCMKSYDALGLSAPQIGVPLSIAVMQCSEKQLKGWTDEIIEQRGIKSFDLKVMINPTMKVVNSEVVNQREGCCSVHGMSALVPRAKEVAVEAFDENGSKYRWLVKDWVARIVQHEIDHLEGKLFTDVMLNETFEFDYWRIVNVRSGNFKLSYAPMTMHNTLKQKIFRPFWTVKYANSPR